MHKDVSNRDMDNKVVYHLHKCTSGSWKDDWVNKEQEQNLTEQQWGSWQEEKLSHSCGKRETIVFVTDASTKTWCRDREGVENTHLLQQHH